MSSIPPRPTGIGGDNEASLFFQWLWDRETGRIPRFVSTPQTEWQVNADGTHSLRVRIGAGGPSEPSSDFYKGEYNGSGEVGKMYSRGVLGEFICVAEPPADVPPETGAPYWHALQYPPPGVWQ